MRLPGALWIGLLRCLGFWAGRIRSFPAPPDWKPNPWSCKAAARPLPFPTSAHGHQSPWRAMLRGIPGSSRTGHQEQVQVAPCPLPRETASPPFSERLMLVKGGSIAGVALPKPLCTLPGPSCTLPAPSSSQAGLAEAPAYKFSESAFTVTAPTGNQEGSTGIPSPTTSSASPWPCYLVSLSPGAHT